MVISVLHTVFVLPGRCPMCVTNEGRKNEEKDSKREKKGSEGKFAHISPQ